MNSQEMRNKQTPERAAAPSCARADDLVAYLYGEACEDEAKDFEGHLRHCASCRAELSAFGQVRESIGAWREQVFGSFETPAVEAGSPLAHYAHNAGPVRSRSALDAIRAFFTLSPAWMRATTAVAGMAICALAALAIANAEVRWNDGGLSFRSGLMRERVIEKTVVVEKLAAPSEEQLKTMVEARVRERLEEALRQGQPEIIQASANGSQPIIKRETRRPSNLRRNQTQQSVPRLELPRDRQYVARDEENVPRLFDLLGDAN